MDKKEENELKDIEMDSEKRKLKKELKSLKSNWKEEESNNPAHYCPICGKFLGFRGFCSKECHNKYYPKGQENKE